MITISCSREIALESSKVPDIACGDTEKIAVLLNNSAHHNTDEITELFYRMALIFWNKYNGTDLCTFCGDSAGYYNKPANIYACDTCMLDLENGEIDVFHADNHPVSCYLFNIICKWANREHWISTQSEVYFDKYKITYNHCHVCNATIENIPDTYVAITRGGCVVAHSHCAEEFQKHFTDYEDVCICENLEIPKLIANLCETPNHTTDLG